MPSTTVSRQPKGPDPTGPNCGTCYQHHHHCCGVDNKAAQIHTTKSEPQDQHNTAMPNIADNCIYHLMLNIEAILKRAPGSPLNRPNSFKRAPGSPGSPYKNSTVTKF